MLATLRRDLQAAREQDPAARGLTVPLATRRARRWVHRVTPPLWRCAGTPGCPRGCPPTDPVSPVSTSTPARRSAPGCSSTTPPGVVIGETAEVGVDVTIYQGVTLGGTSTDPASAIPPWRTG